MAGDRSVVTRFRVEYNQAVQGMDALAGSAQKTSREVEKAGTALEQSARKQSDAAGRLRVAEAQLADAKRKNVEGSAQVIASEEKVAKARREVEASTEQATQAQRDYESALKSQQAQQDKTAQSASTAFEKMARNADQNREAWNAAGSVLTAFGGSIVAIGVAAAKTGVQYNTLQQTSRAAMTTLMGGAKEANAQMDKLDAFARNSPFAKQTFIQAQQQLIGFGVSAEKVVPTLEAVQDAVAAFGGSSQEISSIVDIMSQLQSQGRLSGEALERFGYYGVDAAKIIADQMGTTSGEIKDMASKPGGIPVEQIWDPLVTGLSERFGGAAANVKETFEGAIDRVKAAWRDLSSSVAEPLVGPQGGGLAIDGLNKLADAMRRFEGLPTPIRNTALAIGGLTGAASLAAGGFLLLAPRILETQNAFRTLAGQDDPIGKAARSMGKLGPAIQTVAKAGAAVGVIGSMGVALATIVDRKDLDKMASGTRDVAAALAGLEESEDSLDRLFRMRDGSNLTGDIDSLGDALDRTFNRTASQKFNDWAEAGIQSFTSIRGSTGKVADQFALLDEEMAQLVESGNQAEAARLFKLMQEESGLQADELHRLSILVPEYQAALEATGGAAGEAAEGVSTLSAEAIEAQEYLQEIAEGLVESGAGFLDFAEKATDADTSLRNWIKTMEEQVDAQQNWFGNLETLMDRGAPQEFIDFLMSLGEEGAFRVKQLADAGDGDLQRAIDAFNEGAEAAQGFANDVTGLPDIELDADTSKLREQVWDAEERLRELKAMDANPIVDAQITELEESIRIAKEQLGDLDTDTAHPLVGVSGADESRGKVEGVHEALLALPADAKSKVDVDDKPARSTMERLWEWIRGTTIFFKTDEQKAAAKNGTSGGRAPGQNAMGKATGGAISGPGTGTSDDILTRLSNGEHVWTADEVSKMGGQANVYRLRSMVQNGELQELIPGFATGGAVGAAESRLSGAQRELDRLRKSKRSVTPEQARQDAKEAQAQRRIDEAQAALDRARAEQARRERVSAMQIDLSTDIRRGTIRDQVTGGLSGSYSVVDRLMKLAEDENLGRGARNTARSSAGRFEANLRRLHKQAESVDEKLKQAQEKARELEGISNAVASRLMNDRKVDFSSSIESTGDGNFRQTSRLSGLDSRVSLVKALSDKLGRLAKAGMPGSLLQEIAGLGLEGGNEAADALLGASKTDRASYASAWGDFEHYANLAGANVSSGFYAGGVNAAQGVVKGLESQQRNIENQIAAIAKSMESVFKQVLGIRSPSTVMEAAGRDTGEGARLGLLRSLPGIRDAAGLIAQASMPNFEAMPAPVLNADAAPAKVSIEDMSASTLAGLSEMRQAVSEGFLDMTHTTTESQGVMSESTRMSQEAMTLSTRDNHTQMRDLVNTEQTTMLNTLRERQVAMLSETRTQQNLMLEATRSNFASIRTVGTDETNVLRSNVISTMMGMRSDHQAHLSGMQETNRTGFKEMERSGVEAFRGMRSGIDGEMGGARPELRSNLNDLIDVFDSFTKSVNEAFGDVGVKLSSPTRLYTGGVLPGHTPGRDIHHFRSPSAGDLYLSGGEAIMRPEFTNAVGGEQGVKELNALARGGRIGDMNSMLHTAMYADGGVMPRIKGVTAFADSGVWRSLFGAVKEKFPSVRLHSAYRPGSITATGNRSLHGQGKAVDISPRMDIAEWIRENFGGGTRELIFSPMGNRQINRGKNHYYTGVTRSMHFDHIHWAMDQMLKGVMPFTGDGTYSGGMPTHPFLDKAGVSAGTDLTKSYREAAKKQMATILKKHVGELSGLNPTMGDLGEGIMKSTQEGLVKKAEEHAESMKFVMPGGEGVARWRDTVIQALGYAGLPQTEDYIGAWLRQIQTESGGNPNIMQQIRDVNSGGKEAAGLVQVIPGTFAAFRDKSLPNDRMHPLANLVAGMNWAKYKASRQGRDMLSFIGHGHGYSQGTSGAPPGVALVGEEGPELVELGGGQRIHTNPETRRFLDIQARPEPSAMIDYDRLAQAMIKALPANENGNPLDGAELTLMVDGKQMAAHISSTVSRVAVDAGRSH